MANYQNGSGRNVAVPDENRASWRPQDQSMANRNEDDHDYRSWRDRHQDHNERDPQRWEGSRGSELGGYREDRDLGRTEHYGQGQSGYSAGRYGDDHGQQRGMQNRNDMPSAGFEDRGYELNTDDRWAGRGGWSNQGGRDRDHDRGYGPDSYGVQGSYRRGDDDRHHDQRANHSSGNHERGYQGGMPNQGSFGGDDRHQHQGYDRGFSQNGYGGQGYDPRTTGDRGSQGSQHMGYQTSAARGETDWSPSQRSHGQPYDQYANQRGQHQRGSGPHRGKGPAGYQRSDERIRELVCDALADDDMIDASQIQVTVKDGEVTLSGTVDTRRIKREAEDCVASVSGVRDVQIQLRVRDDDRKSGQSGQSGQSGMSANAQTGQSSTSHSSLPNNPSSGTSVNKDETASDKKHRA